MVVGSVRFGLYRESFSQTACARMKTNTVHFAKSTTCTGKHCWGSIVPWGLFALAGKRKLVKNLPLPGTNGNTNRYEYIGKVSVPVHPHFPCILIS